MANFVNNNGDYLMYTNDIKKNNSRNHFNKVSILYCYLN